ncbi:hypothetical protein G7Y79_00021g050500 [Physcia stellaris]|nr:hypothetical protein G7Y79_00021g050500 [Physcia stellaris]
MAASLHDVDVEMTGQDSNHGHSTEWASRADWIQHKKAISQLYAQNTLPEVMKIMESQYNFKATAKMYKTRIKRWGLDKKHKEKEMRAIVHKRAHRADKGKASVFWIRGKEVDYKDVVRYWERRHIPMAEVLRQRAESSTPEPVECRTPVLPPLSTPAEFAIPERIFIQVRDYHRGSFESGIWRTNEDGFCCRTTKLESFNDDIDWLDAAEDSCERACDALDNRNSQEAWFFWRLATEKIIDMVRGEHPYTFAQLFALVQSELVLGRNHPFTMISFAKVFERFMTAFDEHWDAFIIPPWRLI